MKIKQYDNYMFIKYLIIVYLLCVALVYMCAFRHVILDVKEILPEDRGYFLVIIRHILNVTLTLGMIMYWLYWFDNKQHVLVSYLLISLINIIIVGVLIRINYLILAETYGCCGLHMSYVFLTVWYIISLILSVLLLVISIGIILLSVLEMVKITNGKSDRYTMEDDFVVKSRMSNIFCATNFILIILLVVDKFELIQSISIRDLLTKIINVEAVLLVVYPVFLTVLFINRLIRRNKKNIALVTYIILAYASHSALYTELRLFSDWSKQFFICGLILVMFGYYVYIQVYKNKAKALFKIQ